MKNPPNLYDFVDYGEVAEATTHLLSLALRQTKQHGTRPGLGADSIESLVLQRARDYLSTAREGFTLSVRTTEVQESSEIKYLLNRVLTDWDKLSRELDIEELVQGSNQGADTVVKGGQQSQLEEVRRQMIAFGMAVVAMGYLPRLPSVNVSFPQSYGEPPTYRDIPVPRSPAQMLTRIEEMEETLWHLASQDMGQLVQRRYGPLRRTYGFFEASAWLSSAESKRFGVKRSRGHIRRF